MIKVEDYENKAVELFEQNKVTDILAKFEAFADSMVFDVTTEAGRKDCKKFCADIRKSNKYIDEVGKKKVAELKALPKIYDANRKNWRDSMEEIFEKTRKPLTDWEEKEQKRVADTLAKINAIDPFQGGITQITIDDYTPEEFQILLNKAESFEIDDSFGEFETQAIKTKDDVTLKLQGLIAKQNKHLEEQAELERLRKEREETERKEREAKIAQEAAERAQREAEETARKREATLQLEQEAAIKAKEDAERKVKEAEENAKHDAELAVQREKERAEAAKKAEQEAAAKRKANKKHNAKINNAAAKALLAITVNGEDSGETFLSLAQAKLIVTAIAKGQIPNVTISY